MHSRTWPNMPKLVLDPYHDRLAKYRLQQNLVATIYLNAWFKAKNNNQEGKMAYQLATSGADETNRQYFVDKDGQIAAEVAIIKKNVVVKWFRSLEDYKRMDQIGQRMRRKEEAAHV